LDNGILTPSHFWHFIVPTWEAQAKSKISKPAQVNYLHHVKTMGYQPWKIRIESELEVEVFLTTIALCFNTSIELIIQNTTGVLVKQTVNPCGAKNTIYLSKRVTMDNLCCIEMWLHIDFLETYILQHEKVIALYSKLCNIFLFRLTKHPTTSALTAKAYLRLCGCLRIQYSIIAL